MLYLDNIITIAMANEAFNKQDLSKVVSFVLR